MKLSSKHMNSVLRLRSLLPTYILIITCAYGCVTIPDGELQLGPKIVRDMHESRTGTQALNKGRPIYIEARSYPQILDSGDIWAGGPVLLNLGREDISLDALVSPATASAKNGTVKAGEGKKP